MTNHIPARVIGNESGRARLWHRLASARQSGAISGLVLAAACLVAAACEERTQNDATGRAPAASESAAAASTDSDSLTAAPAGARVYFVTPEDGDTVTSPFRVEFGAENVSIVRAGDRSAASGHHHLIVDVPVPSAGKPIPADANHIHFGDASTSTELNLSPGEHRLTLVLGDYLHVPHNPPIVSETITVTVTE